MMNQSTIDALKAMKFSAMVAEFERQLNDPSTYGKLGFEKRFSLLVDAEWNRRQQNKLIRTVHKAHFAVPGAMVEDIEYHEDRRLDKAQILRFATCQYIDEKHHIILKGASGSGKTFLACALGNAACRKFKSVRYIGEDDCRGTGENQGRNAADEGRNNCSKIRFPAKEIIPTKRG